MNSFSCSYLIRSPGWLVTSGWNGGRLLLRRTHYCNENIGDARSAYLAQRCQLIAVNAIEQQHAATENRTFMHRFECASSGEVLRIYHHLNVTCFEFFHAALQHDSAAVDKHQIGQNILD